MTLGTGGGGSAAGVWSLSLPSGWTTPTVTNGYQMGFLMLFDTGTITYEGRCFAAAAATTITCNVLDVASTYAGWAAVHGGVPFTWVSGDVLVAQIRLEIDP